ncbi:DUF1569 domain-containing protein [Acidobacterium sp. S8]|uniref:DUF1569 domain-containing protein n=1 Tax=Acidobacterium sp. S8 TaxID=1641854 RepID=UPI002738C8DA|nr:DUF1569 domain-containing protein [Acidobacterium sp. S8]
MCQAYAEALEPLTAVQSQAHPAGNLDRWNAQQVVEHLLLSYRSTIRGLEERLLKGRATQAPVTPQHEMMWRRYIGAGVFPAGQKAPPIVVPGQMDAAPMSGLALTSSLRTDLETMDGLLDQCAAKFGPRPMASHIAFGPLSADQWREFHCVHGRHHLIQLNYTISSTTTG